MKDEEPEISVVDKTNIYGVPDEDLAQYLAIQNEISKKYPLQKVLDTRSYGTNPTKEQVIAAMKTAGLKYNIPFEIIYGIGVGETGGYNGGVPCQFWPSGTKKGQTILSGDDGIGMMQVTPWAISENFDRASLEASYQYNIEAGCQVILGKWRYVNSRNPIGTSDPSILENWYFTLWAYNGLSYINNPSEYIYGPRTWSNSSITWTRKQAYQQDILDYIKTYLGITITPIPIAQLPVYNSRPGIPASGKTFSTPLPYHYTGNSAAVTNNPAYTIGAINYTSLPLKAGDSESLEVVISETNTTSLKRNFKAAVYAVGNSEIKLGETLGELASGNSSLTLKFSNLKFSTAGSYKTKVVIYDTLGNSITSRTGSITDIVAPASSISLLLPSAPMTGISTVFSGTVSSDIVAIKRQLSGGELKDAGSVSNGKFSFNIIFDIAAEKELTVFGYDSKGNIATKITKKFNVSSMTLIYPLTMKINTPITFNGTASSNIVKIKRQLSGGELKDAGNVSNGKFSFNIIFDIAAEKELTIFGYDQLGNLVAQTTKKFNVIK